MANEFAKQKEHSAEYFGEARDYWWNDDFLELALRRWSAAGIRKLLDVGCGVGHWGRTWARILPEDVEVTGVDREAAWVEKAREKSVGAGLGARCSYQVGLAEQLPFPDGSFDFVTCQTVLIHVPDARAVLAEMTRVTRPGGMVVVAEPNNAALPVIEDALAAALSVEHMARLLNFQLTCLRGKAALGLGDETIGRLLPSLFKEAGLEGASVSMNEKACPIVPPYSSPRERALIEEMRDWAGRDFWIWSRADTERYFIAGGAQSGDFAAEWGLALELRQRLLKSVTAGTYTCAGGALFYLISGRKKA